MQRTVTILLSDKRSGATLLEQEFCKHSAITHVSYTPHTYNETHYWLKAACLLSRSDTEFYGGLRPTSYGSQSGVRKSITKFLEKNVPKFVTPCTDEALVFNGWDELCDQFADPVFFEKSPQHPHHWAALKLLLSWIQTTSYKVRVIGLVRNPMSVMYSAMRLFQTNPNKRQFGWAHANRNILEFGQLLDDQQFHFVRYEDIVNEPETEFRQICEFIGIDYEHKVGQSVHTSSINRWRDDMAYSLQLEGDVHRLARELGYTEADLFNPPKPKPTFYARVKVESISQLKQKKSKIYNFIKRLMIQAGLSN